MLWRIIAIYYMVWMGTTFNKVRGFLGVGQALTRPQNFVLRLKTNFPKFLDKDTV